MGFKEKLFKQILSLGGSPMTERELQSRLNFRSVTERKVLRSAIRDMLSDGSLIELSRGRYAVASAEKLIKGELKGNRNGYAFLIREDSGPDLFVPNRSLSGALNGDTVLVRKTGDSEGSVVSVVKRGKSSLVGTYIRSGNFGFVTADDDSNFKDIFVPFDKTNGAKPMSKVVVKFKIDEKTGKPSGEIVEVLGKAGDRDAEVLSILRSYDFRESFPPEVLKAAENVEYKFDPARKDFRDLLTITIDGDDAKDFDDAISIEKIKTGYRLYVHIADVSNYVKIGGKIDKEAYERATSVYFPGSVFPMLPESISNGVCSLRPDEEKLTLTAVMDIDGSGTVKKHQFYESIIRSNYRMTYKKVTAILNGDSTLREQYKDIVPMLEISQELAKIIEKKRNNEGAINFITKESQITLDEKGNVLDIQPYPYEVSNGIIEQFMIIANETVAKALFELKLPCVYRVHEQPSEAKMEAFKEFIRGQGYDMDTNHGVNPKIFSDLLEKIKGSPAETVISKIMLRSMQKAKYSTDNNGHFGLSLEFYCHFTSPIRRYPDLMVHRMLKAYLTGQTEDGEFVSRYKRLAENAATQSSEREIAAEKSERDIDDYYKAVYMTGKIGEKYTGIVSGVLSSGIFAALDNTVEGFVPVTELPDDRYGLDEKNYRLIGTKYTFSIGDKVEVIIKSAVIETRSVGMGLISSPQNHLRKKDKGVKI